MSADRQTVAFIDLAALRHNYEIAQRLAGERSVIAVVKADAYGHGAVPVARALCEYGCDQLAVVTVDEAAELREAGISAAILVMGGVHDSVSARRALELSLTPVLHHRRGQALVAETARGAASPWPVQVEVDTGMHRMGSPPSEALGLISAIAKQPSLQLAGVFTHFASADEPDLESAHQQLARFRVLLGEARELGLEPGLIHAANSAALLAGGRLCDGLPEAGAVRPGLMLYGANPGGSPGAALGLRPVMSVRTSVVALHDVAAGEGVGYGGTFRPAAPTRVATLPIGYADGVLRSLGNRGEVWLAGERRPIVGRVSMDYITVDVADAPVELGDEAVFFGVPSDGARAAALSLPEARLGQPVEDAARAAGTLAYELLVRVGSRVPRRFSSDEWMGERAAADA